MGRFVYGKHRGDGMRPQMREAIRIVRNMNGQPEEDILEAIEHIVLLPGEVVEIVQLIRCQS